MKSNLYKLISGLNQAVASRQLLITVPYSRSVILLLVCLKENALVLGWRCTINPLRPAVPQITVYLMYYLNRPVFSSLFIYSSKKRVVPLSVVELKKFENRYGHTFGTLFLLQTNQGFATHVTCVRQGKGGALFGQIRI